MRGEPLRTEDAQTVANVFRLAVGVRLLPQFPDSLSVEQVVDGCAGYVERKLADDGDWMLLLRALPRERLGLQLRPRLARSDQGVLSDHATSVEQGGAPGWSGRPEINRAPVRIWRPAEMAAGDRAGESRRIVAAYEPSSPFEALAGWKARLCKLDVHRRDAIRAARSAETHAEGERDEFDPLDGVPDPQVPLEPWERLEPRVREIEGAIAALPDGVDRAIAEVRWSQRRDLTATGTWEKALDRLATAGFEITEQAARQRLRRTVERAALSDYLDEELAAAEREELLAGREDSAAARTELIGAARGRWRADRALRARYKRSTALGSLRDHEKSTPPAEPIATRAEAEPATWLDALAASDEVGHAAVVALLGLATLPAQERLAKVAQEIKDCCGFTEHEDQLRRRVRSAVADAPADLRRQLLALLD